MFVVYKVSSYHNNHWFVETEEEAKEICNYDDACVYDEVVVFTADEVIAEIKGERESEVK